MTRTRDETNEQIPIQLADRPARLHGFGSSYGDSFGIYSCRFSADGNEIIAGGSGNLFGTYGDLLRSIRPTNFLSIGSPDV